MAVLCRLACNHNLNGKAKFLFKYLSPRNKSSATDHVLAATCQPASQSLSEVKSIKTSGEKRQTFSNWRSYQPYLEMMKMRREEAQRSLLIEIEGPKDSAGVKSYCESYGDLNKCYYYRNAGKKFVLVEFKNKKTKSTVMENAFHSKNPLSIPVTTPYLFFRHDSESNLEPALPDSTSDVISNEEQLLKQLESLQCHSNERLKTELYHLHQKSLISDLSVRLRFLVCNQLEMALGGLFVDIQALPFGSSVCGIGRNPGDLDIFLLYRKKVAAKATKKPMLFYHSKASQRDKNLQLKVIGDLISIMLPGCANVLSILSARVPIIKYRHTIANLECDLQNSSVSGVDLSHILWIMNSWDTRFAPLVYTIRIWAAHNMVTSQKPGIFITNFSLVILVIFFLQTQKILPSLELLKNLSDKSSSKSLDPDSVISFPDLRKISENLSMTDSRFDVDSLLLNFFKFISNFEFDKNKISIYYGTVVSKTSFGPLEIENPVDPTLNIARNVSKDALQVFKRAANEAYFSLNPENYQSQSVRRILRKTNQELSTGAGGSEGKKKKKDK